MYHPTTRLLTILELRQARGSMSGADLAARLEVDRRTGAQCCDDCRPKARRLIVQFIQC